MKHNSDTIYYPLRTILPKKEVLGYAILVVLWLISLLVVYLTGYWNGEVISIIIFIFILNFISTYRLYHRKINFISFTPHSFKYSLDNTNEVEYTDIESIDIGTEYVKVRSMNFPHILDLRYAQSEKEAHEILSRFETLKKEYVTNDY